MGFIVRNLATMILQSVTDLWLHELSDLYSAEQQLIKAMPRLAEAATASELQDAFTLHLEETKQQLARLEQIFESLKTRPEGKPCKAMQVLLAEADELLKLQKDADPDVFDAALIGAQQRVEHYEIAGYGCARTYAKLLGNRRAGTLLETTLQEESATDRKLTELAESSINLDAVETDKEILREA